MSIPLRIRVCPLTLCFCVVCVVIILLGCDPLKSGFRPVFLFGKIVIDGPRPCRKKLPRCRLVSPQSCPTGFIFSPPPLLVPSHISHHTSNTAVGRKPVDQCPLSPPIPREKLSSNQGPMPLFVPPEKIIIVVHSMGKRECRLNSGTKRRQREKISQLKKNTPPGKKRPWGGICYRV